MLFLVLGTTFRQTINLACITDLYALVKVAERQHPSTEPVVVANLEGGLYPTVNVSQLSPETMMITFDI